MKRIAQGQSGAAKVMSMGNTMNIKDATKAYETWLSKRIPLLKPDLEVKHQKMAEDPFSFFRATFYRWVELWPKVCPELNNAPKALGVGDLHIENFGTWRDGEGRLIWGVNDFDEAAPMAYTNDLVRLTASALLALSQNDLACEAKEACDAILAGFRNALAGGGRPFVLAEHHGVLRDLARSRDPVTFWQKLDQLPTVQQGIPVSIKEAVRNALPESRLHFRIVHRQAGLGSLGRRRYVALSEWRGGLVAREAKELAPSACYWLQETRKDDIHYQAIMQQAVRVIDPFVCVNGNWLIRRLAPDCSRIELTSLPKRKSELKLLEAMGWETANIHLGTKAARRVILDDLSKRPGKWLRNAAEGMAKATLADWKDWSAGSKQVQRKKA